MITEAERLDLLIKDLEKTSEQLKARHSHGDWDNWRAFMNLDMKINEYKIKQLEDRNRAFYEALEDYKDY